jgi:long-chain acyl-CoA synthetase
MKKLAKFRKKLTASMKKFGNWEKIKRFELTPDVWSIEGGQLSYSKTENEK